MNDIIIRTMTIDDYDDVAGCSGPVSRALVSEALMIPERALSDFFAEPNTSVVAEMDGKVVGSILCGHDGRQGCLYHVCVDASYRQHGIGRKLVAKAIEALKAEQINKVYLIAFTRNEGGNAFWKKVGWQCQDDRNYYDLNLNEANMTVFNE